MGSSPLVVTCLHMRRSALGVTASLALIVAGCSHTVAVYSEPDGAAIYVNGASVGRAPTQFSERSGYHKSFDIRAELAGYEPWTEHREQNQPSPMLVPSVVGAYFILIPIVGVLWGYQLEDQITLMLKPAEAEPAPANDSPGR